MTRRVVSFIGVLLVLLSLVAFLAFPKQSHAMPLTTTSCTNGNGCVAYQVWNSISDHGSFTSVQMGNPADTYFSEFIQLDSPNATILEGVEKGSGGFCSGSNLHWFYRDFSSFTVVTGCPGDVNTNDPNLAMTLKLSYFASNGGGFFFGMEGAYDAPCPIANPCSVSDTNGPALFTSSHYYVNNQTGSFTGHHMWGVDFSRNQFFYNGVWSYDATSGTQNRTHNGCSSGTCTPPQMYWQNPPNGSNNLGGDLYACLYDSTSNKVCNIGS